MSSWWGGVMRSESNYTGTGLDISEKPVALKVALRHIEGAQGLVYRVDVIDPKEVSASPAQTLSSSKVSSDGSPQNNPAPKAQKDDVMDKVAKYAGDAAGEAANPSTAPVVSLSNHSGRESFWANSNFESAHSIKVRPRLLLSFFQI